MKIFQKELPLTTRKRYDFVKITEQVKEIVNASKLKDGIVHVISQHTTASVILQENDEAIFKDMINAFERIFPLNESYHHSHEKHESNENAIGHALSPLIGTNISTPIVDGELKLGTWQDIFFVELDKGRNRTVSVIVIGE